MSITASVPVLQGSGGAVLSAEDNGLLLERPREHVTIPPDAIARVRAEGRSVAVELRAPAGAAPTVYRIDDVDEADATAFADRLTALLEGLGDEPAEVDGKALVVLRTLRTRWQVRHKRRITWFVLGCVAAVVAASAVAGTSGGAGYGATAALIGALAVAALWPGAWEAGKWAHRRRLIRRGAKAFARPSNVPGVFLYVDASGTARTVAHASYGSYVEVRFAPEDPADVAAVKPDVPQRLNSVFAGLFVCCGVVMAAVLALLTADALTSG
ncbi:hypothetical protein [Streptomyces sp. NPDC003327]